MEAQLTLEAVHKLLELKQQILSSGEIDEIDAHIEAAKAAYEAHLLEVESVEASLTDIEKKLEELVAARAEQEKKLEEHKGEIESIEYDLQDLKKQRSKAMNDFAQLEQYRDVLASLSNTISEVSQLFTEC